MYHFAYGCVGGAPPKQHVQLIMLNITVGNKHEYKGNMKALHDMIDVSHIFEVPSTENQSNTHIQRGSNPMPIPGRHQASVRGGNPVDFLMFSAIQTLSARHSHHCGSQKVYCGSQYTWVLGRHSSFIAQLRRWPWVSGRLFGACT